MEPNTSLQLKDIKPLIEIPDTSLYLYWGLIFLGTVLATALGYFLYRKMRFGKKEDKERQYLEALNTIDWSSPKKAAYRATYYGRLLATDERRKGIYSQMLPLLEKYKYKKETEKADEETMNQFEIYKRVCNESV